MRSLCKSLLGIILMSLVAATSAYAQAYPNRPIRLIHGLPPGGATDQMARHLATFMGEKFGVPVVVDARPGGATSIAGQAAASAPPDGYTLFVMEPSTLTANPGLFAKLPYDYEHGFVPISQLTRNPLGLLVQSTSPINDVKQFVAAARQKSMTFGSPGQGTLPHFGMELFMRDAGIKVTHVPYKGGIPAIQDLLSGQIDAIFMDVPSSMPYVTSGKFKFLAVSMPQRLQGLPEVPTFLENGFARTEAISWFGIAAPAKTPPDVIARLNTVMKEAMVSPAIQAWLKAGSIEGYTSTSDQFSTVIKSERDKYGRLIKDLNLQVN